MKRKRRNLGMQLRFGISLAAILTCLLVLLETYQYLTMRRELSRELEEFTTISIAKITENLVLPLWDYNEEQITKSLVAEMGEKRIYALIVRNPSRELIVGKARDEQWQLKDSDGNIPNEFISVEKECANNGKSLGVVTLYVTRRFMDATLRREMLLALLKILVVNATGMGLAWVTMRRIVMHPISRMVDVANTIAKGDLTCDIPFQRDDEIGVMANAFQVMIDKVSEVVLSVKTAANQVTAESRNLMASTESMSQGATQQAAAAEETSASMEEMAANIRQSTENAKMAEQIALKSAEDARQGGIAVRNTMTAMQTIQERIMIIQQIAQQTNLLSLNAAIEAVKAQEYGKGFAVVASEVRLLATHSREAADEIERLVKSSVTITEDAGQILERLVPNSEKTAALVQEICAASMEQQSSTDHINTAVQQLDSVIQENVANTEQLAASAESLASQAEILEKQIAFFTVAERRPELSDKKQIIIKALQSLMTPDEIDDEVMTTLLKAMNASNHPQTSSSLKSSENAISAGHDDLNKESHGMQLNGFRDEKDDEFEKF